MTTYEAVRDPERSIERVTLDGTLSHQEMGLVRSETEEQTRRDSKAEDWTAEELT